MDNNPKINYQNIYDNIYKRIPKDIFNIILDYISGDKKYYKNYFSNNILNRINKLRYFKCSSCENQNISDFQVVRKRLFYYSMTNIELYYKEKLARELTCNVCLHSEYRII